jgi:hypothetical protein
VARDRGEGTGTEHGGARLACPKKPLELSSGEPGKFCHPICAVC